MCALIGVAFEYIEYTQQGSIHPLYFINQQYVQHLTIKDNHDEFAQIEVRHDNMNVKDHTQDIEINNIVF